MADLIARTYSPYNQLVTVVREFVSDCDAVDPERLTEEWPDLAITYEHALNALVPVNHEVP